ncbi:cysteine-rich secretory family protein [Sphingomonas sp. F9_3S_D5_B_2]
MLKFALAILASSAVAAPRPLPPQPPRYAVPYGTATGQLAVRILAAHNRERQLVGNPLMIWDPTLAASAAAYGPTLARLHQLVHSPRQIRPGQRENLARALHASLTPEQLVGIWVAEKRFMRPGLFPAVSATGNWMDVAHYTQMVWPTTTRVGCALYQADWDYLICRYSPPGNVDGQPVFAARVRPLPPVRR